MRASNPDIVDWPSFLFALFVDSLLVWAPTVVVFVLAPQPPPQLLLALVFAGLVANAVLYARGATLGTIVAGFRLFNLWRKRPGLRWGLVLFSAYFGFGAGDCRSGRWQLHLQQRVGLVEGAGSVSAFR